MCQHASSTLISSFQMLGGHESDYKIWDDFTLQGEPMIQLGQVVLNDEPGIRLEVIDEFSRTMIRPVSEHFGDQL